MTEEKFQYITNLKQNINNHKEILQNLYNYRNNIAANKANIIEYFSNHPLFDISLNIKLKELLDREIIAARQCIENEEENFNKL